MLALLLVYPFVLPHPSAQDIAKREAEFRHRNAQTWKLTMDSRGFVMDAVTKDAKLAAADLPQLREFVRANADLFGLDKEAADKLGPMKNRGYELLETNEEIGVIEQIVITQNGDTTTFHATFGVHFPAPTLMPAQLAKRVAGKRYRESVTFYPPKQRDCAMSHGGCATKPAGTVTRELEVEANQVSVFSTAHVEGNEVRLVRCIDLAGIPHAPADPKWHEVEPHQRTFAPLDKDAPALPLVVDAITGETLPLQPEHCSALRNLR